MNQIEIEREIKYKNEQSIQEMIEKEKELRVMTLEKEKEEKKNQINQKNLKKKEEFEDRKQSYQDLFKTLQKIKNKIFKLGTFTGFNKNVSEINNSVAAFKF